MWYFHRVTSFVQVDYFPGLPVIQAQSTEALPIGADSGADEIHPLLNRRGLYRRSMGLRLQPGCTNGAAGVGCAPRGSVIEITR
jgi:hypothetical protein